MEKATNELDQRLMDRMVAFKKLVMIQDKVAECLEDIQEFSEQNENKLLSDAAMSLRPSAAKLLSEFNFHFVGIMLDGDPRYYGDEEE